TGTLTEGKPKLVAVVAAAGFEESEVLALAASIERASEHPLASAIVSAAAARKVELAPVSDFDSPAGKGAVGVVSNRRIILGNAGFLAERGITTAPLQAAAEQLRVDGATAIFMAVDAKVAAVLAIADPIKATTPAALQALAADRIQVVMVTGDHSN